MACVEVMVGGTQTLRILAVSLRSPYHHFYTHKYVCTYTRENMYVPTRVKKLLGSKKKSDNGQDHDKRHRTRSYNQNASKQYWLIVELILEGMVKFEARWCLEGNTTCMSTNG